MSRKFEAGSPGAGPTKSVNRHAEWIARCFGRPEVAPIGADDIAALAGLLSEEWHPEGSTIFRTGDAPVRIGIVREGSVELGRELNGRRVVLQILGPGDSVGDLGVFLRITAPYEGVALEDTLLLSMESVRFHRLLEERPRLAWRWMTAVSSRLVSYQARLLEVLAGGLDAQIASVLVRRAERGVVNLSQTSIAELVGGNRSSVNRILKRLEERQLVRVRYGQVEIADGPGLARVAGID